MSKISMKRPPTPPKDAVRANLALLLNPPDPESEEVSDEANPFVDEAELDALDALVGPEVVLWLGAGSGEGEFEDESGVMVKLWVDTLR